MYRLSLVVLAVGFAATAAFSADGADAAADAAWDLLAKEGFEKEGSQTAWREEKGKKRPGSVIERVEGGANSGRFALRLVAGDEIPADAQNAEAAADGAKNKAAASGPGERKFYRGVSFPALEKPGRLRVNLFVKGLPSDESRAVFTLIPRNAEKIVAYTAEWAPVPSGDDWQEVTLEKDLPAGTKTFAFMIRIRNPSPGLELRLDDLSFELRR